MLALALAREGACARDFGANGPDRFKTLARLGWGKFPLESRPPKYLEEIRF